MRRVEGEGAEEGQGEEGSGDEAMRGLQRHVEQQAVTLERNCGEIWISADVADARGREWLREWGYADVVVREGEGEERVEMRRKARVMDVANEVAAMQLQARVCTRAGLGM